MWCSLYAHCKQLYNKVIYYYTINIKDYTKKKKKERKKESHRLKKTVQNKLSVYLMTFPNTDILTMIKLKNSLSTYTVTLNIIWNSLFIYFQTLSVIILHLKI